MPEKVCCSRWDHAEMSSRRSVITTSGFGGFLLPVCICRQQKLSLEPLAWLHMKTWMYPSDFSICGILTRDTLEISFSPSGCPLFPHQNLGDSNRYGKKFWGFCSQYYLGKVTEAFKKIPSSFGAVVRKPGLGINYPPLATRGLSVNISTTVAVTIND